MDHQNDGETKAIESVRESDKAEDGRKVPDGGLVEGAPQAAGASRPDPKTIDRPSFVQWQKTAGVHCPVPVEFDGLRWVPGDWDRVAIDNAEAVCWAHPSGVVLQGVPGWQDVPGWLVVYREPGAEGEGWALCMTRRVRRLSRTDGERQRARVVPRSPLRLRAKNACRGFFVGSRLPRSASTAAIRWIPPSARRFATFAEVALSAAK